MVQPRLAVVPDLIDAARLEAMLAERVDGVSALVSAAPGDFADLIDRRTADAELAIDRLRARFGDAAVVKGLVFDQKDED